MKTSQKGIDLIKSFETLRLKAYRAVPTEKYLTIGWGHYGSDVKAGDTISESEAESLLIQDLSSAEDTVNTYVNVKLRQNQFDALVLFVFNVGEGHFKSSTLLTLVNRNPNDVAIRAQFGRWIYSGGKELGGLVRRRRAEADLYFSNF